MKKGTRLRFGKDVYKYVGVKGVRQTPSAIELLGNPAKAHVLEAESSGKIKMVSGVVLDSLERLPETRPVQIQKTSPPRAYLLFHNGPRKGKTIRLRIMSHKASGGLIQTQFPPSLKIEPGEEYEIYFAWSKKK